MALQTYETSPTRRMTSEEEVLREESAVRAQLRSLVKELSQLTPEEEGERETILSQLETAMAAFIDTKLKQEPVIPILDRAQQIQLSFQELSQVLTVFLRAEGRLQPVTETLKLMAVLVVTGKYYPPTSVASEINARLKKLHSSYYFSNP